MGRECDRVEVDERGNVRGKHRGGKEAKHMKRAVSHARGMVGAWRIRESIFRALDHRDRPLDIFGKRRGSSLSCISSSSKFAT